MQIQQTQTRHSPSSASVKLYCVAPELLDQVWPRIAPFIKKSVLRGTYVDYSETERRVFLGNHQLWVVADGNEFLAAGITSLEHANGYLNCRIIALGGKQMKRWFHLFPAIEQFARDEGCKVIRVMGRKGWTRLLKDYQATRVMMEKAL